MSREHLDLRLHAIAFETAAVRLIDLRDPKGRALPDFAPGAHVDLRLHGGLGRSYSLIGDPADRSRYLLGVQREPHSRGGSRHLCDEARVGDLIEVSQPVNHFPLVEHAPASVFIAGGIGITPILPMIERLAALGQAFVLHWSGRDRGSLPFQSRVARHGDKVRMAFSREPGGRRLDIAAIVAAAPADAELYCCGPRSMLDAFAAAAADRDPAGVHVEHFSAAEPAAVEGGFEVVLARSGRTVPVPAGKTILEALNAAGIEPSCSCVQGVCGTCETRVLEGIPDHRDVIMTPEERAESRTMMICVSGAKTACLVLDL
ncbi:MAG TPA: PDR/VanB family oxidoreductase [Hyphomicrobiaceae bacterium]|nr:PDR/VanB family oxidoreductase [Hyphomicrobiaceae bacterium]